MTKYQSLSGASPDRAVVAHHGRPPNNLSSLQASACEPGFGIQMKLVHQGAHRASARQHPGAPQPPREALGVESNDDLRDGNLNLP